MVRIRGPFKEERNVRKEKRRKQRFIANEWKNPRLLKRGDGVILTRSSSPQRKKNQPGWRTSRKAGQVPPSSLVFVSSHPLTSVAQLHRP